MTARDPDDAAPRLQIVLFGPPQVQVNGQPLPRLRSYKGPWLLALLVLRDGVKVERDWLAALLWPESSERRARANLRNSLRDLRHALGTEAGRLSSPTLHTLTLDLSGAEVDVLAFDQAIARGDSVSLEQAVAFYRGPLLEGCAEEWAFQERQAREQAYLHALETLVDQAVAAGEPAAAERYLRRIIALDPLRETASRSLMQTLAASGNYAAALLAFRDLRHHLHREINADPDQETRSLFDQLRADAREKAVVSCQPPVANQAKDLPAAPDLSELAPPDWRLPTGTVTFLFTDIEGSTQLWEQGADRMRASMERHDALLRQAIFTHHGSIFKTMGDQFCAAFSSAPDALAAALDAQRSLCDYAPEEASTGNPKSIIQNQKLRVRMALHTGTVTAYEGDYSGLPRNRVVRLLAAGHGGQILLSRTTQELVRDHLPEGVELRDLGEHRLKDLARPEQIFQLITPELPADFPPLATIDLRPQNLPAQVTPLVGREQEVAAVQQLLRREAVRLVTLTGPGGIGKTRVGLQAAAELLDAFPHGVFLVDLAPISDPDLVAPAIARTLGVTETGAQPLLERLKEYLRAQQRLLLLDNFEQVLSAAPLVSDLLAACPRLKVLVTSRAVLHLRGEHEYPVLPLALPDLARLPAAGALSQYAAVELFIQRALASKFDFAVTNENAPAVAGICHRLDGIPLAIELAAARIRLFAPQALLAGLESRLKLLTGGARDLPARQHTLRSAIGWSYDLLDEADKTLFRRLSVFVGGCTEKAAEEVCSAGETADVRKALGDLIDRSLLRQEEEPGGEPRFAMLETIREFAHERLSMAQEVTLLRHQHATYFGALAARAVPPTVGLEAGLDAGRWLDALERELDNLRSALDWCIEIGSAQLGLPLGDALARFWALRGSSEEGQRQMTRLLALPSAATHSAGRAKALLGAAGVAWVRADGQRATSLAEESLMIGRELDDKEIIGRSLRRLAILETVSGELHSARVRLDESLEIARGLNDRSGIADSLLDLASIAMGEDDLASARWLLEESLAQYRAIDRQGGIAWAVWRLGNLLRTQGELEAAKERYRESLQIFREQRQKFGILSVLMWQAHIAKLQSDWETAVSLLEELVALFKELGNHSRVAHALMEMGLAERHLGHLDAARECYLESIRLWSIAPFNRVLTQCLRGLATVAAAQSDRLRSARLLAASMAVADTVESPLPPPEQAECERLAAVLRAAMGDTAFAVAWDEGRAMSPEQAVAYTLEDNTTPG